MADGIAASKWAPISPATGRLDAFVWQQPAEQLGAPIENESWIAHAETSPRLAPPETTPEPEPAVAAVEASAEPEIIPPPKAETVTVARGNGAVAGQKVIFPMPAAPDDPGPTEEEQDIAENSSRVGFR
jgi:HemY protein